MKIYREKTLVKIKNQALNKIYNALVELHERDNTDDSGGVKEVLRERHDELLDIALKHLNHKPTNNVYDWIKKVTLKGIFY